MGSLKIIQKHFQTSSHKKLKSFKPFLMNYGYFTESDKIIDEILAVYMPSGKSYTGLDQIEIFCHGGQQVVKIILEVILKNKARMAEPGEFTRMAFSAGKIDLTKAESVAEIISANTESSYQTAREHLLGAYQEHIGMLRNKIVDLLAEIEASIDYPEDDIDPEDSKSLISKTKNLIKDISELVESYNGGRIINEGYKIAIAGRPNAGKSSLFNLLLKQQRALVTSTPGTTRDYLSEWIEIGGFKVNIIDTAGLRKRGGIIEKAGQKSAKKIIESSDLVLWIIDLSDKNYELRLEDLQKQYPKIIILMVGNKIDVVSEKQKRNIDSTHIIMISCLTKYGINQLKKEIIKRINEKMPDLTSGMVVTSLRHKQKLSQALKRLKVTLKMIQAKETPELTAYEIRSAMNAIDEITGKIYTEDVLDKIFSKFCIGK